MPPEFRRLLIQTCMQRPGRHIEKWNEPSSGVAANTEHKRIPKKVPTRMNGPANDTFAHNFKSLYGQPGFGRIPDNDAYLRLDRKSTRLNSSHTVISYAVFCLKKKKSDIPRPGRRTHPLARHPPARRDP